MKRFVYPLYLIITLSILSAACTSWDMWSAPQTPHITAQPQQPDQPFYYRGQTAEPLSITAEVGNGDLRYQWYRSTTNANTDGVPITGETSPDFIPSTSEAGTFYYYVVLTNTQNGVSVRIASNPVEIVVEIETPEIIEQPQDAVYLVDETPADLVVKVKDLIDGGTPEYQWYKNGAAMTSPPEVAPSLSPDTASAANDEYYVIVSYGGKEAKSRTASITVSANAPRLNRDLGDASNKEYNINDIALPLEIMAIASGGASLYQWYSNTVDSNTGGVAIQGETLANFTPPTDKFGVTYYYCEVANSIDLTLKKASKTARIEVANLIYNAADLDNVRNALSEPYKVMANFDLTGYTSGAGWIPIGDANNPFTGSFNGNAKKISRLYIDDANKEYAGLFGYLSAGAKIDNLTVEVSSIRGKTYSGGVAAYIAGTAANPVKITDTHVERYSAGGITATDSFAGGIAGYAENLIVNGCSNSMVITGTVVSDIYMYYGGIVGFAGAGNSISNCTNSGNISLVIGASSNQTIYAGGILGYSASTDLAPNIIYNGKNSGKIIINNASSVATEEVIVGGIAGSLSSNDTVNLSSNIEEAAAQAGNKHNALAGGITGQGGKITNSYNTGNVFASGLNAYAGGIVARFASSNRGSINRSYNTGEVAATAPGNVGVGGIAGETYGSNIFDSYNRGEITGTGNTTTRAGGIVGNQRGGASSVSRNYSRGSLSAIGSVTAAGGIVGYMDGVHTISNNAVGAESPGLTGITGLTINRILARYSDASANLANNIAIENLRALGGVFDSSNIALYGSSRTQEALTNELTYKNTPMATPSGLGWRFGTSDNDPWKMPTGSGYPILYWQP